MFLREKEEKRNVSKGNLPAGKRKEANQDSKIRKKKREKRKCDKSREERVKRKEILGVQERKQHQGHRVTHPLRQSFFARGQWRPHSPSASMLARIQPRPQEKMDMLIKCEEYKKAPQK